VGIINFLEEVPNSQFIVTEWFVDIISAAVSNFTQLMVDGFHQVLFASLAKLI
jgi:hypothetical protein